MDYINVKNEHDDYLKENISIYAQKGYSKNNITEVVAECFASAETNNEAASILNLLTGGY